MDTVWRWAKNILLFLALGTTAALAVALRRSNKLRRVEGAGYRVQRDIERVSDGIDDVSEGVSQALDDNEELAGEIDESLRDIESDIDQAEGIADKLTDNHRRSESTLERLERANQRFRELLAAGDKTK